MLFDEARYFDGRLLSALVLVYAFGEIWEFIVSFLEFGGIKYRGVRYF